MGSSDIAKRATRPIRGSLAGFFLGAALCIMLRGGTALAADTSWQESYAYTLSEETGEILITRYTGNSTSLNVPATATVDGRVYRTVLYGGVWQNKIYLKSVVIEEGVSLGENAKNLFYNCINLTKLDISGLDTSAATDMSFMFYECKKLQALDVSGFETRRVKDMQWMFEGCASLSSLNVRGFVTRDVTNMNRMFDGCAMLRRLNLELWDISNVTEAEDFFQGCSSLVRIDTPGVRSSNTAKIELPRTLYEYEERTVGAHPYTELTKAPAGAVLVSASYVESAADQAENEANEKADAERAEKAASVTVMYRLYNPNSGEHFYTGSETERDALTEAGWKDEGIAWSAPMDSEVPVYRLYAPLSGDHHYTTSEAERDSLVKAGWRDEGIGWYSDGAEAVPLYRLYNPNALGAGSHHYTVSAEERDALTDAGWRSEGIGWYGCGE